MTTTAPRTAGPVTIDGPVLKDVLNRLRPAYYKAAALDTLRTIHVGDDRGDHALTVTDLDLTSTVTFPGVPAPASPFLAPFADLDKLSKATGKDGTVTLEPDTIGNGILSAAVADLPVAEYPRLPDTDPSTWVDVDLLAHLPRLLTAVSHNDDRPILTSVYVDGDGALAATDSYRLAVIDTGRSNLLDTPALLPRRLCELAVKFGGKAETVGLYVTPRPSMADRATAAVSIVGDVKGTPIVHRMTARVVEGDYPTFRRLLPSDTGDLEVAFGPEDAKRIRDLDKFADAGAAPVRIMVDDGNVRAVIIDDGREYAAELAATAPLNRHNQGMVAAFNPQYLADMLEDSPGRTLRGIDTLKPWVVTDDLDDGAVFRHLIMPVRVG